MQNTINRDLAPSTLQFWFCSHNLSVVICNLLRRAPACFPFSHGVSPVLHKSNVHRYKSRSNSCVCSVPLHWSQSISLFHLRMHFPHMNQWQAFKFCVFTSRTYATEELPERNLLTNTIYQRNSYGKLLFVVSRMDKTSFFQSKLQPACRIHPKHWSFR